MKRTAFADRATFTSRDVRAGCFACHGAEARWFGGQAQGTAARHHDLTGHETWCDVVMSVRYGAPAADPRPAELEDAIASAQPPSPDRRFGGPAVADPLPRTPSGGCNRHPETSDA